jgi:hypothetical protein
MFFLMFLGTGEPLKLLVCLVIDAFHSSVVESSAPDTDRRIQLMRISLVGQPRLDYFHWDWALHFESAAWILSFHLLSGFPGLSEL